MSWMVKNFAEVVFLQEGPGIRKHEYQEDGYPMINVRCVQDGFIDMTKSRSANMDLATSKWKHFQIDEGDILFTISGTIGRAAIVKKSDLPLLMNTSVVRFKSISDDLDRDFLFHYVSSSLFVDKLKGMSTGTAIQNVGPSHLKKMTVPIPPLREQKQIVSILDKAFAAIDQAKANIEKNIQNAEELFQSKLIDVFSQKSEGWEEISMNDKSLFEIIDGDRGKNYPKKVDFLDKGHCVFMNTGNVRKDGFNFSKVVYISEEKDKLLRKGKILRDDVVLTTRGTLGNVGLYHSKIEYDNIRINSGMLILRPNKERILPEYLYSFLRSPIMQKQILEKSTGAAQPQLPIRTLITFKIPINTDKKKQRSIVEFIERLERYLKNTKDCYLQKLKNLSELKSSLLQKAFMGELNSLIDITDQFESTV